MHIYTRLCTGSRGPTNGKWTPEEHERAKQETMGKQECPGKNHGTCKTCEERTSAGAGSPCSANTPSQILMMSNSKRDEMILKKGLWKRLGEDVRRIVLRRTIRKMKMAGKNLLPNVVVVNLNVLCPSMEDRILGNRNAALVVTPDECRGALRSSQLRK